MTPSAPPPRGPGQRAGISRDVVLAHATRLAEREGVEAVTMRRLASELGAAPNAIYTYFATKRAILDAVRDAVLAELAPPDPDVGDWRHGLAALMRASRRLLLAHPQLAPIFLAGEPGPNAIRLGEATLRLLARGGVTGAPAAAATRALLAYTLGFATMEASRAADAPAERAERLARGRSLVEALPADEIPATRATAAALIAHPGDADFDAGLGWLIAGIAG